MQVDKADASGLGVESRDAGSDNEAAALLRERLEREQRVKEMEQALREQLVEDMGFLGDMVAELREKMSVMRERQARRERLREQDFEAAAQLSERLRSLLLLRGPGATCREITEELVQSLPQLGALSKWQRFIEERGLQGAANEFFQQLRDEISRSVQVPQSILQGLSGREDFSLQCQRTPFMKVAVVNGSHRQESFATFEAICRKLYMLPPESTVCGGTAPNSPLGSCSLVCGNSFSVNFSMMRCDPALVGHLKEVSPSVCIVFLLFSFP